jgi:hypothetical protein
MPEQVTSLDLVVTWEPNAPGAVLMAANDGRACLAMEPHPSDSDERAVVLRWEGCQAASMGHQTIKHGTNIPCTAKG